nr:unnamed protein product [Digitaria exilis]
MTFSAAACRNREGTSYKEDICSMLQEVSAAPPIIESNPMDDNSSRLLGEDDPVNNNSATSNPKQCIAENSGFSNISGIPSLCKVGCSHDSMEGTKNHVGGATTCGTESMELVARKQGDLLADVKLEPALEGYEVETPRVHSTHAEGSVPSVGVKDELNECELPSICEKISFSSRQRRKRKTTSCSTEKTLEEDTYTNDEGIAYCSRRRRRKKTATDSIEKALDEDAPGLLELFPKRTSLLKLSIARHEKGEKAIYCLSCLISLIEQARYLHFRDCPVEWGWCRDLQSFIFVFRSHNRIVLERPEYGYATYFFEVVQSLTIEWQIRRLVTAMKLSGCGRTALIENKPLLVGEDLTEGEARILEEYGWIRNTGLGTMVNYRDRVVHDRWTERSVNDWRAKIGKLLMTGYAEGQSITIHGPKKVVDLLEATRDAEFDIKLEDPF